MVVSDIDGSVEKHFSKKIQFRYEQLSYLPSSMFNNIPFLKIEPSFIVTDWWWKAVAADKFNKRNKIYFNFGNNVTLQRSDIF